MKTSTPSRAPVGSRKCMRRCSEQSGDIAFERTNFPVDDEALAVAGEGSTIGYDWFQQFPITGKVRRGNLSRALLNVQTTFHRSQPLGSGKSNQRGKRACPPCRKHRTEPVGVHVGHVLYLWRQSFHRIRRSNAPQAGRFYASHLVWNLSHNSQSFSDLLIELQCRPR